MQLFTNPCRSTPYWESYGEADLLRYSHTHCSPCTDSMLYRDMNTVNSRQRSEPSCCTSVCALLSSENPCFSPLCTGVFELIAFKRRLFKVSVRNMSAHSSFWSCFRINMLTLLFPHRIWMGKYTLVLSNAKFRKSILHCGVAQKMVARSPCAHIVRCTPALRCQFSSSTYSPPCVPR